MEALRKIGSYEVKIGGVSFGMRCRTTLLMMQLGDINRVMGLLADGRNKERTREQQTEDMTAYTKLTIEMESKVCEVALLTINGEAWAHLGQEWPELDPVTGPLLKSFLTSGLDVDPIESSCTAQAEQKQ